MKQLRKNKEILSYAQPAGPRWEMSSVWQALLLIAITLATYYPTIHNGFIWDDESYIENNKELLTAAGLGNIWFVYDCEPQYYPLTHTTFWIEYHLWKLDPMGYHIDNMVLQMAGALMLWRLLARLGVPGAFVAALIFAVHPVQVESVAWATERKNVMSGFLYFLSLWCYLHTIWGRRVWEAERAPVVAEVRPPGGKGRSGKFSNLPKTIEPVKTGWGWYSLSFVLFCMALLSKSVTSSLPAVVLLLLWWKRGTVRLRDFWPLVPFFVIGATMGALTGYMEKTNVGAIGPDFDWIRPLDRVAIAGRAIWFYLYKLIVPYKLMFIYPRWNIDEHRRWELWFAAAVAMALVGLWLLRRRIGRGPLVAALFFVGTLFPALGFMDVFPMRYSFVADHFQYLAMIGPVTLGVAAIARKVSRPVGIALAILAIAPMCCASYLQTHIYKDFPTLFRDEIAKNPDCPMAHNNLAGWLRDHHGNLDQALKEFWTAARLKPSYTDWDGIGQIYAMRGDYQTALSYYQQGIAHSPDSPEPLMQALKASPYCQIGLAYSALAKQAVSNHDPAQAHLYRLKAIQADEKCIDINPGYEPCRTNLAAVFLDDGRVHDAIVACEDVLDLDPECLEARVNLGNAYRVFNRPDAAIAQYQLALQIDPKNEYALVNLGSLMGQEGHYTEAEQYFESALQVNPNNIKAMTDLGTSYFLAKKYNEAINMFQAALRGDPTNETARHNLAAALAGKANGGG